MVADGLTLRLPEPMDVPPHEPVYHLSVPPVPALPPLADNVVAPPQVGFTEAEAEVGALARAFTVTVTDAHAVTSLHGAAVS